MAWRPNLAELPEQPGVYLFRDAKGRIVYIGKALNLRRRIASYFQQRRRQPARLRRMLARARAVTLQVTDSELQALLLESRLIKQEAPPFNRLAVEYACPTFVKLTCTDPFPRLLLTREFAADGNQYLGPFPRFDMAEVVLAALQRLTPLRICEGPIVPGVSPRPCEAFYVKKCVAPCTGSESASGYPAAVEAVLALLQGGRKALLQRLAQERERAAAALQFERARHLHALLTGLDAVTVGRPLALVPVAYRNLVVRLRRDAFLDDVFCVRHGLLREQLSVQGSALDRERLRGAIARCYFAEAPGSSLGGQAVVDELRIVGGWLHRTAHRARWVSITPRMSLEEALEGICQLHPSTTGGPMPG